MKRRLPGVLLLLLALPVWAKEMPPGCAWLCGNWVFDAANSDASEAVVDAALEKYKEPSGSRRAPAPGANLDGTQSRAEYRAKLLADIEPAPALVLGERGDEVLIKVEGAPDRRIFPGEPHSRVDSQGTAKISADWKKDALIIEEAYSSRHGLTETYALQPDGTLLLTRVFERNGVRALRQKLAYRRR